MDRPEFQLSFDAYDPTDERRREALLALGNGLLLVRGCTPDAAASDHHYPGTYRAGCYDRLASKVKGDWVEHDSLVNLPNWLPLTFRVRGETEWFALDRVNILHYRYMLDMVQGVTRRNIVFDDDNGRRTRLQEERLVSMARPHLAAFRQKLVAENWSGEVELRSALDGAITNANVKRYERFDNRHLATVNAWAIEPDLLLLETQTRQSRIRIVVVIRTRVAGANFALCKTTRNTSSIATHGICTVAAGKAVVIEKTAAIVTSRDPTTAEPIETAQRTARVARSFSQLRSAHRSAWIQLWHRSGIEIARADIAKATALHWFHVLQTVSPHSADLDVGFPPHGWQEGYHGQIFWDDVLVFPALSVRFPNLARALLLYRYRRLEDARRAARCCGFRGAMFPWRSTNTGEEAAPSYQLNLLSGRWMEDHTRLERHIGAAIAYNIWQYYSATGDRDFMREQGAEMLIEIARFWVSIARFHPDYHRYEIKGVMGPDEFHDAYPESAEFGIDNNAYTNVMAAWTLARALEVLADLPTRHRDATYRQHRLDDAELAMWDDISRRLRLVFHEDGVISQFEGYEHLRGVDLEQLTIAHPGERADWVLEAQSDDANAYQITKQADVLMLYHLLPGEELCAILRRLEYDLSQDQLKRTADYYSARTTHDSSLSRVAHAGALARLDPDQSWRFFLQSLQPDMEPCNSSTSEEGLHLGAMAGSIDVIQRHYLGLGFDLEAIKLDPALPRELGPVKLAFEYRQDDFTLEWTGSVLKITASPSNRATATVRHHGQSELLAPGTELLCSADPASS
jgi:trehalose/maltose hydrolase-like predicted phosphorylase